MRSTPTDGVCKPRANPQSLAVRAQMAKKTKSEVRLEETSEEISCNVVGLEYRCKKLIEILETTEGQEAIDQHCGPTATKFKELFGRIREHLPAAGIAAVAAEVLKGGLT